MILNRDHSSLDEILNEYDLILNEMMEDIENINSENIRVSKEIEDLEKEIHELKSKLALYESPHVPSSKQFIETKTAIKKSKRASGVPRKSTGKRGGSKKGKQTSQTVIADETIDNHVDECLGCGKTATKEGQDFVYAKQVIEIPQKIEVIFQQHKIYQFKCTCGTVTEAGNPTLEETSLGPNLLGFITSTRNRTGASFENISRLLIDLSDNRLSQTALNRGLSKVAKLLQPERDKIAREVMQSSFIHADETSHRLVTEEKNREIGSKKVWVWVFATNDASYYHVDLTRSMKAIDRAFEYLEGKDPPVCVCDVFPSYNKFEHRQYCWAHLLRDSKALEDECTKGKILHDNLVRLFEAYKELPITGELSRVIIDKAEKDFNKIAITKPCSVTKKLQKRLKKYKKEYLRFLNTPRLPMDNNRAERLLKSVIFHRKSGQPFRSEKAMEEYGIFLTVLNTWKEKGLNINEALQKLILENIGKPKLIN